MTTTNTIETKHLPKGIWMLDLPEWKGMGAQEYIQTVASKFVEKLKHGDEQKPDYIVTRDCNPNGDWSDLCLSNQNFFNEQISAALEKAGLKTKVQGRCGGHGRALCNVIREEFPDFEDREIYVSHYVLGHGCLYRVVR